MGRTVRLYLDLLWLDIAARSQYRVDFFIGLGSALLQHAVTLGTLWLIFLRVPALGGWNAPQAAVLYALFSMTMGLVNLVGAGLRELPGTVEDGELDHLLILPANPYFQLLPRFNPMSLGDLALGLTVLAIGSGPAGVRWTAPAVLFCLLAVVCGAITIMGLLTVVYSLAFWIRQSGITGGIEQVMQLARYPSGIYPRWVQVLITWIFPVAFASFFPAGILTGVSGVTLAQGLLAVPVAAAAAGAGAWVWTRGLGKYEGTGS